MQTTRHRLHCSSSATTTSTSWLSTYPTRSWRWSVSVAVGRQVGLGRPASAARRRCCRPVTAVVEDRWGFTSRVDSVVGRGSFTSRWRPTQYGKVDRSVLNSVKLWSTNEPKSSNVQIREAVDTQHTQIKPNLINRFAMAPRCRSSGCVM